MVKTNDVLKIEKLEVESGTGVTFDKVLLTADDNGSNVKIGAPYLAGVSIDADVVEQGRADKIRVVKFKNKIRYKRVIGHRQHFTKVKVK